MEVEKLEKFEETKKRYLEMVSAGAAGALHDVISVALDRGMQPSELYLQVILPAQREVGMRWERGEISVSAEHLATQLSLTQLSRLKLLMPRKASIFKRVVVTTVEGDLHELPARIISDFLFVDGWEVDFLGINTPSADLIGFLKQRKADLLAISVTMKDGIVTLQKLIARLKRNSPDMPVLIGGPAFAGAETDASNCGADGFATDALGAQREARRLVGVSGSSLSLKQYLRGLGQRVQRHRRERKLSQQQLADWASLDRAYISMVEHGKQNVTIGAVVKLANAMGLTYGDLLRED